MEKINTDYKRRIWKIEANLFNMRKPWRSPFKMNFHCHAAERVESLLRSISNAKFSFMRVNGREF